MFQSHLLEIIHSSSSWWCTVDQHVAKTWNLKAAFVCLATPPPITQPCMKTSQSQQRCILIVGNEFVFTESTLNQMYSYTACEMFDHELKTLSSRRLEQVWLFLAEVFDKFVDQGLIWGLRELALFVQEREKSGRISRLEQYKPERHCGKSAVGYWLTGGWSMQLVLHADDIVIKLRLKFWQSGNMTNKDNVAVRCHL